MQREQGNSSSNHSMGQNGSNENVPQIFGKPSVEFSKLQLPEITLPKGGGGIKGIEEKFQASPSTGSSSFSIDLPVSPARNGFSPQLGLTYDSGSGNGIFGLGWSLSLPSIVRKTEKGLPLYNDHEESDIFQFAGVEDLVPVLEYNSTSQEWELPQLEEKDFIDQNGNVIACRVRKYRPRIEGAFYRIERYVEISTGVSHWVVKSRDNVTTVYGKSLSARITSPESELKSFRWYPEYSYDSLGNFILYEYKVEDNEGVDYTKPNETNRINTGVYLKRVKYGNKSTYQGGSIPTDFMFETVFDYGEHGLTIPSLNEADLWLHRSDSFSSYRSGYEVRTRRLCKRVFLYHHFTESRLIKSVSFTYDSSDSGMQQLVSVSQSGFKWNGSDYDIQSIPSMEFEYSKHEWNEEVYELDSESLKNFPQGLSQNYQFTDLFGEGLSGVLAEQDKGWYYKKNKGNGEFGPAVLVSPRPSIGNASAIQDLEANNEKYFVDYKAAQGYAKLGSPEDLEKEGEWQSFQNFKTLPQIDFTSPNLKFVDLNGDGKADLLIDEDSSFLYYRSEGKEGFSFQAKFAKSHDEELGPQIVFADASQSIFMADMSGDGLTDIVRIRNGEVCYWPNLGHGRFGAKVTMDNSPWFDEPDQFNPDYIKLADIDGSGPTDLIYLGEGRFKAWLNESGNGWSVQTKELDAFPMIDNLSNLQVVDFLGKGTACVVWSSMLAKDQNSPLRYVDLMGGKKPHLMVFYKNNMGKEVRLDYTPSTEYYLDDEANLKPWVTKLPFVIHCLSSVETEDKITGQIFKSTYSYHHGYYDYLEREFRGFGRVDQKDSDTNSIDSDLDQNPVITKTWFHLGADLQSDKLLGHFRSEYNTAFTVEALKEPILPAGLSTSERSEAIRACKGMALRQEVYEEVSIGVLSDPYTISEKTCTIQLVQGKEKQALQGYQKYASFLVIDTESLSVYYEKNQSDPRISHSILLDTDELGNPLKAASIVYGRGGSQPSDVPNGAWAEQIKTHVVVSQSTYTQDIDTDADYRLRVPFESKGWELTGYSIPTGVLFDKEQLLQDFESATVISFESLASGGDLEKRLVEHTEVLFRQNDLSGNLPSGTQASKGLVYQSYALGLTPSLITDIYDDQSINVSDALLAEAGYAKRSDGNWWLASGKHLFATDDTQPEYSGNHFYLPIGVEDAFGNQTLITYDEYDFLTLEVTDALGNTVSSVQDYRTLSPKEIIDPNGNHTEVETDALGQVVKTAAKGKEITAGVWEGDTLSDPTTRFEYDLFIRI